MVINGLEKVSTPCILEWPTRVGFAQEAVGVSMNYLDGGATTIMLAVLLMGIESLFFSVLRSVLGTLITDCCPGGNEPTTSRWAAIDVDI